MTQWGELFGKRITQPLVLVPFTWHLTHALWGYAIMHGSMDVFLVSALGGAVAATLFALLYEYVYEVVVVHSSWRSLDHVADMVQRVMWVWPSCALALGGPTWGWGIFGLFLALYALTLKWSEP